jgi:regulator of protease activity HflC (stomatin/prohibitin superfamily)
MSANAPLVSAPMQTGMAAATAPENVVLDDQLMADQEQTPAYKALRENNLICNQYRVRGVEDLDIVKGAWDLTQSLALQMATCNGCCCFIKFFVVKAGHVQPCSHSNGTFIFFGEGVHVLNSPYVSNTGPQCRLTQGSIINGTKAIVTVTQGFVGYAMDRGQPILLPPGMHQWDSPTIQFQELIDLQSSLIRLGPFTLVTVDEGYAAVTQDNGVQKVLDGGKAYMLTHRNWKFEKYITTKLQTNDVGPIKVTTGDNVPLEAVATCNWLIDDVRLAARMAANTMQHLPVRGVVQAVPVANSAGAPQQAGEFDISKLREDVLRQVTASLAAFIGTVSYSSKGNAGMAEGIDPGVRTPKPTHEPDPEEKDGLQALFDWEKLNNSVTHANEICSKYGVKILSINLISATPADPGLLQALSQGAVANVAAEQTETAARGSAKALNLQAKAEAEAARIRAEGDAQADLILAEGSLKAARQLETSEVAVMLAKMSSASSALKQGKDNSFFFGLEGGDMSAAMLGATMARGR